VCWGDAVVEFWRKDGPGGGAGLGKGSDLVPGKDFETGCCPFEAATLRFGENFRVGFREEGFDFCEDGLLKVFP